MQQLQEAIFQSFGGGSYVLIWKRLKKPICQILVRIAIKNANYLSRIYVDYS